MTDSKITLFTKPNCQYCDRAKAVLQRANVDYQEHNVTASQRNADASIYLSGVATTPQIFIGSYHINGAEDLERLEKSGRLTELLEMNAGDLSLNTFSDDLLHKGAEDVELQKYIPQSDGSRDNDPEAWPILRFYKEFFGFWPNTFAYLHHWSEAYKLFLYCHNFSAIGFAKQTLSMKLMSAVGYSTSNAHGCSYCQVHSTATGGEQTLDIAKQLKQARQGAADSPFDPFEVAIADLAAQATRNQVEESLLARIRTLAQDVQGEPIDTEAYIISTLLVTSALGFLNVFNDLTGLEIEGEWARQANEHSGIEAGRHGAEEANPSNLDYELPEGGPSLEKMIAKYEAAVGDLNAYAKQEFGLLPSWMQSWPQPLCKRHAYLYGELMGERHHTLIPAELKHLMARVSAIAKDHAYLAGVEGYLAYHTSLDKERSVERIRQCFIAATNRGDTSSLFSEREQAALQFAWLSAQVPLATPLRFVEPVIRHFDSKELVHLIVVCAVASMVQRFVAVAQSGIEAEVAQFLREYELAADPLMLRYPRLLSKVTAPMG